MRISVMGICMESALRGGKGVGDFLRTCKERGADGVEFASRHIPPDPARRVQVKAMADELGLQISSYNIATDLVGMNNDAKARRRREMVEGIAIARELGSPILMVGTSRPKDMPAAEVKKRIAAHLREATEWLEGAGIRMTMENRAAALADIVGRASDIKEICEAIGSPRFGWTFDTGNFIMADYEPVSALRALMPFVAHVHVKDTLVVPEDKANPYHEVCIGKGQTDIPTILTMLRDAGYDQCLSLEITYGADREADLRESIQCIRELWRR